MNGRVNLGPIIECSMCILLGVMSQFDLRNLLVVNPHQVDEESLAREAGAYLEREAKSALQSLVNRYYYLVTTIHRVHFLPVLRTQGRMYW